MPLTEPCQTLSSEHRVTRFITAGFAAIARTLLPVAYALLLIVALLALPQQLQARESILSFDSKIFIPRDGRLSVRDTITVRAERKQIKRGIYRDFSTVREEADGRLQKISYKFREVTRNGVPEKYRIEYFPGNVRLIIGDENVLLPVGEHAYSIRYRVDRQVQFGADLDFLIWNVAGDFENLPIDSVTATIRVRKNRQLISADFYAGAFGDENIQSNHYLSEDKNAAFYSRQDVLQPGEIITVRAEFEKRAVREPDFRQLVWWYLRDNLEIVGSILILFLVSLYYVAVWLRVGRDPPGGVVVPDWRPPEGISPALANYVQNRGFGSNPFRALSSSLVNLAVGGFLTISGFDKTPSITRTEKTQNPEDRMKPATGETALLSRLDQGETLQFSKAKGKAIKSMVSKFRGAIEREHGQVFFRVNRGYCIFGVALSVLGVIALLVLSQGSLVNLIPPLMASIIFLIFIGVFLLRIVRSLQAHRRRWWQLVISLIPLAGIIVGAASIVPLIIDGFEIDNPLVLLVLSAVVAVNALFFKLMQAPTPLGQQVLAKIEGLKTYLQLAEQDRLNLQGAPKMSPQHFETLLPFAIALELEKPWSSAFDRWLESATVAEAASMRSSNWYGHRGRGFNNLGRDLGRLSRTLEQDMRSSIPAPKSSRRSSGGRSSGGFAGGGGGSSGGGGW